MYAWVAAPCPATLTTYPLRWSSGTNYGITCHAVSFTGLSSHPYTPEIDSTRRPGAVPVEVACVDIYAEYL